MSRPIRVEFPGAHYHITSRGALGCHLFRCAGDRHTFLRVLGDVVARHDWTLYGYLLLDDRYRLIVATPGANLSRGMRQLNGVYTQYLNRKHGRDGALFDGRFRAVLFEREGYLQPLSRSLALEPLQTGLARAIDSYRWSSHRAVAGIVAAPEFLGSERLLETFGKRRADNQRKYRRYVAAGVAEPSPLDQRTAQVLLGSEEFKQQVAPLLQNKNNHPRPKRSARRRSLNYLFRDLDDMSRNERNERIVTAHVEHHFTLAQIGDHLGLHYTTVSKVINA